MKKHLYLLLALFIIVCFHACSPGEDVGYIPPFPISFQGYIPGAPDVFIAFSQTNYYTSHKITQVGLGSGVSVLVWFGLSPDTKHVPPFNIFSIKYYSAEITNEPGWDRYNQLDFEITNLEHLVYYSTNFTNGSSISELYDPGNSLPFYLGTNGTLSITTKGFQTNQ